LAPASRVGLRHVKGRCSTSETCGPPCPITIRRILRTHPVAPALLVALAACGCASSDWARTESVPGGRLYLPKVWAPLLPGSMYPKKSVPVKSEKLPAIVLVCPERGDCRKDVVLERAAQRGLVVLAGKTPDAETLRARAEVDANRIGWLLVSPTGGFPRRWKDADARGEATAVLLPPRTATAGTTRAVPPPFSPSKKILLATLLGREPPEAEDGTVLKLYSPDKKGRLPNEAFRDAVEWLAGELGAR
jgi:hypothetical protein